MNTYLYICKYITCIILILSFVYSLLNKTDGATYEYNCARNLTTVLCVHEPRCIVENCSNHGDCINGRCLCHENWEGLECNQLQCGATNCSAHGICKEGNSLFILSAKSSLWTHLSLEKMAAISQTTFSNAFSRMEIYESQLKFSEVCS